MTSREKIKMCLDSVLYNFDRGKYFEAIGELNKAAEEVLREEQKKIKKKK